MQLAHPSCWPGRLMLERPCSQGGLVLASIALLAVLPEFIIEVRFAYTQQAELVTANLTGATRLTADRRCRAATLGCVPGSPKASSSNAVPACCGTSAGAGNFSSMTCKVFAIQVVARGRLTVVDGIILLALYVLYARRVQGTPEEEPAVAGVPAGLLSLPRRYQRPVIAGLTGLAAVVVLMVANPFVDALLLTGTSLGFDPYFLIQSVVPVATEAPETSTSPSSLPTGALPKEWHSCSLRQ